MHVFIDNTDIGKLIEAKNNIKCQKIMFASASHEFRTPLNAILNSYSFISDAFDTILSGIKLDLPNLSEKLNKVIQTQSQKFQKFTKMGTSSSLLLLSLVEDILNLSKMDLGTFSITLTEFSVPELINEINDIFEQQCSQKQLNLTLKVDNEFDLYLVKSDRGRLKQILLNFMSNSFKFTFEGGIRLECQTCIVED